MAKKLIIKGRELGTGKPLVCVPVVESEQEAIVAETKALVEAGTEMIEWRVDFFEGYHSMNAIREVLAALEPLMKNCILVYTYRSKEQGGAGEADGELIRDIHFVGAETGIPDLIDLEYFAAAHHEGFGGSNRIRRAIHELQKKGAHVVVSHHDFEETPQSDVLNFLLEEEYGSGADVVKLAVMPQNPDDVLSLLSATNAFHKNHPDTPLITMAMGGLGSISRIAGEIFGSCVTFGAGKASSAPGQLPQKELHLILDSLHKAL